MFKLSLMAAMAVASLVLHLATPAQAQDTPADPLAYTPTGDALWDAYAQALLEQLGTANPIELIGSVAPPVLPQELLDSWQSEFGDDPRYWQLRYWDATWRGMGEDLPGIDPVIFLEQGVAAGASDAITKMLLYKERRDTFEENWEQYCAGTLPDDSEFAPVIAENVAEYSWFVKQQLALADGLVEACPDESWAWYERAMKRFENGVWEAGLEDLHSGNQAANNRRARPFPISFINEQLAAGLDCGSDVAAGIAIQGESVYGLPNFIRIKDQMKNQEVRLQLGAPLSELAPWNVYCCRFGSMEGAGEQYWNLARVMQGMMLQYMLVETPEVFTVDQRSALWGLNNRSRDINELVHDSQVVNIDDMTNEMRFIEERYGYSEDVPSAFMALTMLTEKGMAMQREMVAAYFRWLYVGYQTDHGELYNSAKKRFDKMAEFDFETYSWPEE